VREKNASPQEMVSFLSGYFLESLDELWINFVASESFCKEILTLGALKISYI